MMQKISPVERFRRGEQAIALIAKETNRRSVERAAASADENRRAGASENCLTRIETLRELERNAQPRTLLGISRNARADGELIHDVAIDAMSQLVIFTPASYRTHVPKLIGGERELVEELEGHLRRNNTNAALTVFRTMARTFDIYSLRWLTGEGLGTMMRCAAVLNACAHRNVGEVTHRDLLSPLFDGVQTVAGPYAKGRLSPNRDFLRRVKLEIVGNASKDTLMVMRFDADAGIRSAVELKLQRSDKQKQ